MLAREGKPIFARHILKTSFSTFDPGQKTNVILGCFYMVAAMQSMLKLMGIRIWGVGCYGVRGVVHTVDVFPSLNATDMKLAHMQCDSMGAPNRRRQRCEYYLPC